MKGLIIKPENVDKILSNKNKSIKQGEKELNVNLTKYHAKYFAYELTKKCASNSLEKLAYSLTDAQVDLNPHQVEAALFAFNSPLSKGALLADEVGLGKTIEAGIILSQKWAERNRRLLIIVPANLRKQWYQELSDKFFLTSMILESNTFNQEIKKGNLNPFIQNCIIITSYNFVRQKDIYIEKINWDLVVIDEAHRLRNVYKPSNKIANSIKNAISKDKKILLTATPLQNSLLELFGLVSIIDNYTFGDLTSFKNQFSKLTNESDFTKLKERLSLVCKRTLRKQVLEYIKYTNRIPLTQEFIPSDMEQKLYDLITDYLQRPNLFALPPSQRQLMTLILRKLLASSSYAIAGTLEVLVNKLEMIIEDSISVSSMDDEMESEYENYDELKDDWEQSDSMEEKEIRAYTSEEIALIEDEIEALKHFKDIAKSIIKNSKGEVLLKALDKGFSEAQSKGALKKAVVFTESTRTQKYLYEILQMTEYKDKIVLFNGSNNDDKSKEIYKYWVERNKGTDHITGSKTSDMRSALIEYFKEEAIILVATEAAAEGINLQFCSLVVNYDLPWNPQRIEQRIGRCHRYGQKFDVVVVNFLNKNNAADQRVYQLLSEKFKLFNGVFGSSDEVLGTIESGVDFEKRIAEIYQKCRTEDEIQKSFDILQKEMEIQIDEKMKITREKLLENFDEEVNEKLKINLEESKININKYENWLWQITRYYLSDYADFSTSDYSFKLNNNPFKDETIYPGPYRIGKNVEDENIYRIGHPLAQKIIDNCKDIDCPGMEVIFDYNNSPQKISILEKYVGNEGFLMVMNLTINSFENEDHILLSGITEDNIKLDIEECKRLFSLNGIEGNSINIVPETKQLLIETLNEQRQTIIQANIERNSYFFDEEMNKLDKWAEDIKNSLEIELKELDIEIKTLKTESKKILNLEEKVKAQREIKDLEKKRNNLRQNLFESQDEVDKNKDNLISDIEKRMKHKIEEKELFVIKWKLM